MQRECSRARFPIKLWCGEDVVNTSLPLRQYAWSFKSMCNKSLPPTNLIIELRNCVCLTTISFSWLKLPITRSGFAEED